MENSADMLAVFQALPGNYLILYPDTPVFTIAAVTDSYALATHTIREEIIGRPLFEVFPDNPAEPEADGTQNLLASLNQVLGKKRPHKMNLQKYDVRNRDGIFEERYWSPLNSPVLDQDNNVKFIIHRVADVTDMVRLEQKEKKMQSAADEQRKVFRQLVMQAPVAIAILRGPSFIIDAVNQRMMDHWNRTAEELLGKPLYEAIPESMNQGFELMLRNIFISGEPYISKDGKVELMKNGKLETAIVDFTCSPIFGLNDTVASIMVVANDITEIVKAREIIARSQKEAS
jgi:PAS domain S-box-containing protein